MPADVPPRPATDATEPSGETSAGRFRIIVETAAYEKVATAKHAASACRDVAKRDGIRNSIPIVPVTITNLRAASTRQPRPISTLDNPPPAKFPRSAARN